MSILQSLSSAVLELGEVVELVARAAQMRLDRFADRHLFGPQGSTDTWF